MSTWASETADASGKVINKDVTATFSGTSSSAKVVLANSFTPSTKNTAANSIEISASIESITFIHNNIT